jgi:hypothetical protein
VSTVAHTEGMSTVDFFISYSPADEHWATWVANELEKAGYTTMLMSWDFTIGTNFIDLMDRGIRRSTAVIAILSRNYTQSTYGRMEWQAAIRRAPEDPSSRLITIRVEDFPLDGLLATITFLDLVSVTDETQARQLLLERIRQAIEGRAKPDEAPPFPVGPRPAIPRQVRWTPDQSTSRGPPAQRAADTPVALLHVTGPRFDRDDMNPAPVRSKKMIDEVVAGADRLYRAGLPPPDALLISGGLAAHGGLREFDEALAFVAGLRAALGLVASRVVVVPAPGDITEAACRAYFAECEADEVRPEPPYWPKWKHFRRLMDELHRDTEDVDVFRPRQPWTLARLPELRLVVAGLNSTMARSHRPEDAYGWVGAAQVDWFARRLRSTEYQGWLRVGLLHEPPEPDVLRDASAVRDRLGGLLDLLICGPGARSNAYSLPSVTTVGRAALVTIAARPGGGATWETHPVHTR